jgi:NAD(P)H-hydrate epimerase
LEIRGIPAKVLLLEAPAEPRGDAGANYAIIRQSDLAVVDLSGEKSSERLSGELSAAEWVVDALLGTGAIGPPRPPLADAIRAMNASPARRLAVDLPSGLDCDTGLPAEPTFRADHTCTFVAPKLGYANPLAAPFLGQVHVVGIGVPLRLVEEVAA